MIASEAQYRATLDHLRRFEEALANLESRQPLQNRSTLAQLETDAVRAQADDLRAEIRAYDQR